MGVDSLWRDRQVAKQVHVVYTAVYENAVAVEVAMIAPAAWGK